MPTFALAADDVRDELKKLEGTWNVVSVEAEGETRLPRDIGEGIPSSWHVVPGNIRNVNQRAPIGHIRFGIANHKRILQHERAFRMPNHMRLPARKMYFNRRERTLC